MADEKADQKTEGKENKEGEKEEEKEEDPFSEIFKEDEEEEKEEGEEESTEEKPQKKAAKKEVKEPEKPKVDLEAIERRIERRQDVSDYLLTDAGKMFGKFAPEIRKAAIDSRFTSIPIKQLAAVILTPTAYAKTLQDVRKQADEEAADSVMGGTGGSTRGRVPEGLENLDPTAMSKEEFAALKAKAKRGEFKIKK